MKKKLISATKMEAIKYLGFSTISILLFCTLSCVVRQAASSKLVLTENVIEKGDVKIYKNLRYGDKPKDIAMLRYENLFK